MQTRRLAVDAVQPDPEVIEVAAAALRRGGLVAFPTETVYGLGGIASDADAVEAVFVSKGRPAHDPLIVHVLVEWPLDTVLDAAPPLLRQLATENWPGPLTLIGRRGAAITPAVSAGLDTVAVRAPAHPVAVALLEAVGIPIAAPSANRFGHVSPTSADHVLDDLDGRVEIVLDAGETPLGIESTVLHVRDDGIAVLRYGAFPVEGLDVVAGPPVESSSMSPGATTSHYAPSTPMEVVEGGSPQVLGPPGVYLGYRDTRPTWTVDRSWRFVDLGPRSDPSEVATRLYAVVRALDRERPTRIVAELTGLDGLGHAIDDRLTRAASGRRARVEDRPPVP